MKSLSNIRGPAHLTNGSGSRVVCTYLVRVGQRRTASDTRHKSSGIQVAKHDLVMMWEKHVDTEFGEKSAAAAVETMVPHATVIHMPVMTGGVGTDVLRQFYATHFIPKMPLDVTMQSIDRTVGTDSIVDEFIFEFTHTVEMDWMLPGLKPTGKKVRVPFVVVVKFEGDKLLAERIYWDQASVLVQLGLLADASLPVCGVEQAEKLLQVVGGQK